MFIAMDRFHVRKGSEDAFEGGNRPAERLLDPDDPRKDDVAAWEQAIKVWWSLEDNAAPHEAVLGNNQLGVRLAHVQTSIDDSWG